MSNNERILSHKMSKKLDLDEIKNVSAAFGTFNHYFTYGGTGNVFTGTDDCYDMTVD